MKVFTSILFLVGICSFGFAVQAQTDNVVVDPVKGNDNAKGTGDAPFLTISRAREAVRALVPGMKGDVVVLLKGGTYVLNEPLVFGPQDSGINDHDVVYRSAPGEAPVISGGMKVTGWQKAPEGRYMAILPKHLKFRQLYVNGRAATRARSTKKGEYSLSYGWDPETRTMLAASTDIPPFTNDPANPAELVAQVLWSVDRLRLAGTQPGPEGRTRLIPMQPERTNIFNKSMPPKEAGYFYHLENAIEFLDEPGEWYFKASTGELLYQPLAGEDMAASEVMIPVVDTLLNFQGTYSRPVRNIRIEGITLMHSNFTKPDTYGFIDHQASQYQVDWGLVFSPGNGKWEEYKKTDSRAVDAAVQMNRAQKIVIEGNTFRNLGGNGINIATGCRDIVVNGNTFAVIAGNGVEEGIYEANPTEPADITRGNRISNNFLTLIGQDYPGSVAIKGAFTQDLVVEHNEIVDVPYTGISVGWGWTTADTILKNNIIRNNHVMKSCGFVSDGAGIYTLSKQPGTLIEDNFVQDCWVGPFAAPSNAIAFYLDEGSSFIKVKNNVWRNTEAFINGSVEEHLKKNSVFENNDSQDPQIIKQAGLEPDYMTARTHPMPSMFPQRFSDSINLELSYAPDWSIRYTQDGQEPTFASALYSNPISIKESATIKARAYHSSGRSSETFTGRYQKIAKIEDTWGKFRSGTSTPILKGARQTGARSSDTGFTWGGRAAMPGGSTEIMASLDLNEPRLLLSASNPKNTAIATGTYLYTIFSSTGGNTPDRVVPNFQDGRVEIRVSGGIPKWLAYTPQGPPWPLKVRLLLRDGNGAWYLSTTDTAPALLGKGVIKASVSQLKWERVNQDNEGEMNKLRAGTDPGRLRTTPKDVTPDFSSITGGGLYLESVTNSVSWLEVNRITWVTNL